jgi:hypothetical protein
MKKFIILGFAALLVFAFTVPAAAVEHELGGYWRTRAFMQRNFAGFDAQTKGTANADTGRIDTRTRIFWTAKVNDSLKLVTAFEMNAVYGTQDTTFTPAVGTATDLENSYGDFGADGVAVAVKTSYVEFNWLSSIWRIGVQPWLLNKGFQSDLDAPGLLWMYPRGDHIYGAGYVRVFEGGTGYKMDENDIEFFAIFGVFSLAEGMTIQPWATYAFSDSGGNIWRNASGVMGPPLTASLSDGGINAWRLGFDYNWNTDMYGLWVNGVYLGGSLGKQANVDWDLGAYYLALGGHWNLGAGDIHTEIFYASGDDNATDNDWEEFAVFEGQSHYWAEIMGLGIFDNQVSNNSPGDSAIGNVWAANLGITWTFAEKHTVTADLWYADRLEIHHPAIPNAYGAAGQGTDLGTEIDLKYTCELIEGLNLDVVAAYLFAGDGTYKQGAGATSPQNPDEANPYELGMRLSLSF